MKRILTTALAVAVSAPITHAQEFRGESCAPGIGAQIPRCVAPLASPQTYNPAQTARERSLYNPRAAWLEGTYQSMDRTRIDALRDSYIRYEGPYGEYTVPRTLPQVEPRIDQISDLLR